MPQTDLGAHVARIYLRETRDMWPMRAGVPNNE